MPITGRYMPEPSVPDGSGEYLDLRIDVDGVASSRRVSADTFSICDRGRPAYGHSWVMDHPIVAPPGEGEVLIAGSITFRAGEDGSTGEVGARAAVRVRIDGSEAHVTVSRTSGEQTYRCPRRSDALRSFDLTIDVCERANGPHQPEYHTGELEAPSGVAPRPLRLETAFAEAGIDARVTVRPSRIDDAEHFKGWSDAELNDLFERQFLSETSSEAWPRWSMWGLVATVHEVGRRLSGVMLHNRGQHRQGFVIFRGAEVFAGLTASEAVFGRGLIAKSRRRYLFTWVHEAGHVFNLPHSDSDLSWMSARPESEFFDRFQFTFSEGELRHLRHGALPEVAMGGNVFTGDDPHLTSGGAGSAEDFPVVEVDENPPVELRLRSRPHFDFMAPIKVEARLRTLRHRPCRIDARLNPECGRLVVYIQRPDNRVLRYTPIARKTVTRVTRVLERTTATRGEERCSTDLDLTYGSHGFYFAMPGEYVIRGYYYGAAGRPIVSKPLRLHVGECRPEDAQLALRFFTDDVGMCLYLRGSRAERLQSALAVLHELIGKRQGDVAGADLALSIVRGLTTPFFGICRQNGRRKTFKLELLEDADHKRALDLTEPALETYKSKGTESTNSSHRRLVYARARAWKGNKQPEQAVRELKDLYSHLRTRVNPLVLGDIQKFARRLLGRNSPW